MVSLHTGLKYVVGHILAGAVVILGTLLVTLICYLFGLAGAPGGIDTPMAVIPEFFALMFTAGVFAVFLSTASFVVSVLLTWLRAKQRFPVWLPVIAVPLVTSLVVLLLYGRTREMSFVAVATALAFVYFGIYWTLLTSSGAVIDFVRRKFSSQKAA